MPLDPSIVSNAFANISQNMPDINSFVNQRVQGAENIYKIERQRKADELVMEDRAAAAAKEQEEATIKALLPAYTYVLKTGDLAGGLDLAPPQYQDVLIPHMKALEGRPLEEIQAALIGSLSASPSGQEALAAIQRGETLGVQKGQLDVSRGNLALERQKAALAARGEGEWKLELGVGGFFWTNARTREVIPADVTGGAVPGAVPGPTPIPAPDVVTPRQPAPGMSDVAPPAGAVQPPTFRPVPKKEDSLNEAESKSVNFALRLIDSNTIIDELEKEGVVNTDTLSNIITGTVGAFPDAVGKNLVDKLESAFNASLWTMSPEEQRLARAQLDFVTAILRSESGAEIKASEFPAEYRKYFPSAGEAENEKLLADKRRARKNAIEGMRIRAGKSGRAQIDEYFAGQGNEAPAPAPAAVPAAPGATLDGIEFLGEEPEGG